MGWFVWGSDESFKVTGNSVIRYSAYEFILLLAFHINYVHISHRFWDIGEIMVEIVHFYLHHLFWRPSWGDFLGILPTPLASENNSPWAIV